MHQNNAIHTKIIRLFNGEASPAEKQEIQDWMDSDEANLKFYSDLKQIWFSNNETGANQDPKVEAAFLSFKRRYLDTEPKVRVFRFRNTLKYAAILLLFLALPGVFLLGRFSHTDEPTSTTVTCAFGDKSTVTLPDGSLVYLNSGSTLTFDNDFKGEFRRVYLEGEAYFSVAKNRDIPFIVRAAEIKVEVLGTEFNIKAYPEENDISTTLAEGSIRISSSKEETLMKPNQRIVFSKQDKKMSLTNLSDISSETGWKEGRLVFRNESLEDLEVKLERWFDVDVEFADEAVKKRKFTGILERESILETISYFTYTQNVGYFINENQITFYSK
jgi:ferric-dicitrate binding protein FerR (iron transport regulator)